MSSIIKKLVSSPTKSVTNDYDIQLDLSYITSRLIVCSRPVDKFPKIFYRNSLNDLVNFLEINHGNNWSLWNFKLESLDDYSFSNKVLKNKLYHFPWPDHECPPFELILNALESINNFLSKNSKNVAVLHCKMGKGRSGLIAVACLMIYYNMSKKNACRLFTEKRMNSGFGEGVSILSQLRYLSYCTLYKTFPYDPQFSHRIDHIRFLSQFDMKLKLAVFGYLEDTYSYKSFYEVDGSTMIIKNRECRIYHVGHVIPSQDIKISVNSSGHTLLPNSVSLWFNIYWELMNSGIKIEGLKKHTLRFSWEQVDGFKGTSLRGNRLFDFMEIYLTII